MGSSVAMLDPRADNSFTYDKQAGAYALVQTWHVLVHMVGAPSDQYNLIYVRAGQRFEHEPNDEDIRGFAIDSELLLREYCRAGKWQGGTISSDPDTPGFTKPFKFDRWHIKDIRGA